MNTRSYLYLLSALCLSACSLPQTIDEYISGKDNTTPPTPLEELFNGIPIQKLWSKKIGKGNQELYLKIKPILSDDMLFITDSEGKVYALDHRSGKTLWQKKLKLATSSIGANDKFIFIGGSEGDLIVLSKTNGEEVWRIKASSEILAAPVAQGNTIILRTVDGKLSAYNLVNGQRLWIYSRNVPALTLHGTSMPVIYNDKVISGFDGGQLVALDLATGKVVWENRVSFASGKGELDRIIDIDTTPIIVNDIIYATSFQKNITALYTLSGKKLWSIDISSYNQLAYDQNALFVSHHNGNISALDRFSGQTIWEQDKLYARQPSGITMMGENLVVGDLEGYLHWLDKYNGQLIGRVKISDAPILTAPTVANNILYAYSSDGKLSAFQY